MAAAYLDISRTGVLSIAGNSTSEAHNAYLYQPEALLTNIRNVLYDQVGVMGISRVRDTSYMGDGIWLGTPDSAGCRSF